MDNKNSRSGAQIAADIGRAAKALVNIVRAALAGGLKGAAIAAVKEAAPWLVKLAIGLLCFFILIPLLVFICLPNSNFGFSSSQDEAIINMTRQAEAIEAAYRSAERFNQEQISAITAELTAAYRQDGVSIDQVEVNDAVYNTNVHWLIAINSVRYRQDLNATNEASLRALLKDKLNYSAQLTSDASGEGENAVTTTTLTIGFADLSPEALMSMLGFTDEEKNWATLIYNTISDTQHTTASDSDGYGLDFSGYSFNDTAVEVIFYHQADSRWGDLAYGKSGTIASSACGPTALAIVIASLVDSSITPVEVAQYCVDNGYRAEGNGTYRSAIPEVAAHYGLSVDKLGADSEKLVAALNEGKLVIAIMGPGHFTKFGHYIVLRGLTSEGKVLVADPNSYERSQQQWALSVIVGEASNSTAAGGPFWAFARP